jgi:hypothetical protein
MSDESRVKMSMIDITNEELENGTLADLLNWANNEWKVAHNSKYEKIHMKNYEKIIAIISKRFPNSIGHA